MRASRRGYDLKSLELPKDAGTLGAGGAKGAKGKKRKRALEAAAAAASANDDDFTLDTSDARFASIYSSSDFAIDPTNPKFRRTAGSESLLQETQARHATQRRAKTGWATSTRRVNALRPLPCVQTTTILFPWDGDPIRNGDTRANRLHHLP